MRDMWDVTGGSDGSGTDRLTLSIPSLGGTETYQVMHALASISSFFPPAYAGFPPPGTLLLTPIVSTGSFPTASSLSLRIESPLSTGSDISYMLRRRW